MRKLFGGIALGAMLCAPVIISAQETTRQTTTTTTTHRYYDPEYKKYHEWNEGEQRAWEHWQKEENHAANTHEFSKADKKEQRDYWRWRHDHPDWHE